MNTTQSFAALSQKSPLESFCYPDPDLKPHEVRIAISHCGLCYSDIHLIDNDWGISKYPLVPGHEIIGKVIEKGALVSDLEIGSRVGVGWQGGSCLSCPCCNGIDEPFCPSKLRTCVDRYGGFADKIAIDSRYAYPLPPEIPSEYAAPLMCAGITVYAPFQNHAIQSHHNVAILGIGGLGHLGLQFAKALGCSVTALSSTEDKKEEALRFGADNFVHLSNSAELKKVANSFDFILSTTHASLNWSHMLELLRPNGNLCLVGIPAEDIKIPARLLVSRNRAISGSSSGGRTQMKEMLAFAAKAQVRPQIELFSFSKVNEAISRLKSNKARYRIVLYRS